jgi:hypothetical protein
MCSWRFKPKIPPMAPDLTKPGPADADALPGHPGVAFRDPDQQQSARQAVGTASR